MHYVVDRLSHEALVRLGANVKSVQWHKDDIALTQSLIAQKPGLADRIGNGIIGGCYNGDEKSLTLDGGHGLEKDKGSSANSPREVYAHEIGHALDCPKGGDWRTDRISSTPEFQQAWQEEMGAGQLSKYATTKPSEGFAEFARAAILYPKAAEKHFPKTWSIWQKHGLAG
jgi:hypothetical protein